MKKSTIIIVVLLLLLGYTYFNKNKQEESNGIESEIENLLGDLSQVMDKGEKGELDVSDILGGDKEEGGMDIGKILKQVGVDEDLDLGGLLNGGGENGEIGDLFGGFEDMIGDLMEDEDMKDLLGELVQETYDMSDDEMDIMKSIPEPEYKIINSEDHARDIIAEYSETDFDAYISGDGSDGFKEIMGEIMERAIVKPQKVIDLSREAKDKFDAKNENFSFGEGIGKGYTGKDKMIYLPLGEKSFADEVVDYRDNPDIRYPMENSLGPPNYQGVKALYPEHISNLGLNGQLTLKFTDNALVDVQGIDLYVFEIGAIEPTLLEVSTNGEEWIEVGRISGGTAAVDISGKVEKGKAFSYVRLTDLNTRSSIPGADIDAVAAIGSVLKLDINSEVLFDFGKADLSEKGREAIKELALQIKGIDQGKVQITGHTDDVGSETTNSKLSLARAKSVSRAIQQELGRTGLVFQERGSGESAPIVPNDSDENRKKNRRVEITVSPA